MRKTSKLIHRWVGLVSGVVVAIVALTGCLYAFADEIGTAGMNRCDTRHEVPYLSPDKLGAYAVRHLEQQGDTAWKATGVTYRSWGLTAKVNLSNSQGEEMTALLHPQTGQWMGKMRGKDFFHFVIMGHRSLWLPPVVGVPIIGISTVAFVLVMITGLVLWVPRRFTKKALSNGLKVKWKAGLGRRLYDLHNSLGFYIALVALAIALTGITWSFEGVGKAYYRLLTGKQMVEWTMPVADSTAVKGNPRVQELWKKLQPTWSPMSNGSLRIDFPRDSTGVFIVCHNDDASRYYRQRYTFYDPNTLKQLPGGGIYGNDPAKASAGERFFRMSYDIHSGSIAGLPGRILVFLVTLIIASLPITGYWMWKRRHNKK